MKKFNLISIFFTNSFHFLFQKRYTRDLYDGLYEECQAALGSQQTVSPRSLMTMMRALNRFYFAPSDKGRLVRVQLFNFLFPVFWRAKFDEIEAPILLVFRSSSPIFWSHLPADLILKNGSVQISASFAMHWEDSCT